MRRARVSEGGQASPEWLGVVLVVSLAFAAAVAAGVSIPGVGLARSIAERIVCAAGLGEGCGGERSGLVLAYGPELAAMVTEQTPRLDYEEGMRALPVDFRSCRADSCAEGAEGGPVRETLAGEPVTVFSHVVDCRDPEAATRDGFDCSGERAGSVYVQYWLYYPGSQTSRALFGDAGFHPDDWESWQTRVTPEGVDARASSHHGYNGSSGDPLNDTGWFGSKPGWTESTGRYSISGGSHAGQVGSAPSAPVRRPSSIERGPFRWTNPEVIRVIPIESLEGDWDEYEFEVTPPWAKEVYRDPEFEGT